MITSIFISVSIIFSTPFVEKERLGIEPSFSYALLKDFPPSVGGGIDIIFVTGEKLGASLGFGILRNKGESLYKEPLPGTELVSAISSKYITLTGFELNYALKVRRVSPFAGMGIKWVYYHEQSKNVYYAPGWKITSWDNYRGNGYCYVIIIGLRYVLRPSLSIENKIKALKGNFYYPPLNKKIDIEGLSFSLGIRL